MGLSGCASSAFKRDASEENPLANHGLLVQNGRANSVDTNSFNIRVREAFEVPGNVSGCEVTLEVSELQIQQAYDLGATWLFEENYLVEAPPNCGIELPFMVGRRDHKPRPLEFFDERQQAIYDTPKLAV